MCGGMGLLGFWVFCGRDEFKEQKCQNLLLSILAKAKKYLKTKDPLVLATIFSGAAYGPNSLPELWVRDEAAFLKSKEQFKPYSGGEVIEVRTSLPISLVYPLSSAAPAAGAKPLPFREMLKQITADFREHISGLHFTVNNQVVEENGRLPSFESNV